MSVHTLFPGSIRDNGPAPSRTFALRCETWDDGAGNRGGAILLGTGGRCLVAMLCHDPETRLWRESLASLPPAWLRASLDDLWRSLPTEPARNSLMRNLGLVDDHFEGRGTIRRQIETLHEEIPPEIPAMPDGHKADPDVVERASEYVRNMPQHPSYEEMRELGIGYGGFRHVDVFAEAAEQVLALPDQPPSQQGLGAPARIFRLAEPGTWTVPVIAPWHEAMESSLRRNEIPFLTGALWSPEVASYFSAPGTVGTYRRQAGTLYPFLAPALARAPELSVLVDAGRPFEESLAGLIASWVSPRDPEAFTVAKLRRLRRVQGVFQPEDVARFLSAVARLELDTMPSTPEGWEGFVRTGCLVYLDGWGARHGLEIDDLVTHADCEHGSRANPAIDRIDDMISRLEGTLVLPFLSSTLAGQAPTGAADTTIQGGLAGNHVTRAVAARMLFRGMGIHEIHAVSNRWHARLRLFDGALPQARDAVSWPALFGPWERGDWRIVCLTLPSELTAEGADGLDPDGMAGLDTCIGGYARKCYAGTSHLLSIRRRTADGWERVSTAEIIVRPRDPMEHVVLSEVQHRGRGNAEPPADAKAAYDALMADLAYRRWAISDAARKRRSPDGFDDGIDWADPASQESVLRAWRPYLPRKLAKLDVMGMRAHVRAATSARMGEIHARHGRFEARPPD